MKTGPFAEHSNQLWNISAVPSWSKVNQGLIRMYKAEVSALGRGPSPPALCCGPALRCRGPRPSWLRNPWQFLGWKAAACLVFALVPGSRWLLLANLPWPFLVFPRSKLQVSKLGPVP